MKPSVVVIDNEDSFIYNIVQIIEELGIRNLRIMKESNIDFDAVHQFDKILLSPGPGIPSETGGMIKVITMFFKRKSILGVCLGHQAIARAFGGRLERMDVVSHGIKNTITIRRNSDYLFNGLPDEIEVGRYHSWVVSLRNFPRSLQIVAATQEGLIMAITHKQYDVKGVQFHPESIMTPYGKDIIRNWLFH